MPSDGEAGVLEDDELVFTGVNCAMVLPALTNAIERENDLRVSLRTPWSSKSMATFRNAPAISGTDDVVASVLPNLTLLASGKRHVAMVHRAHPSSKQNNVGQNLKFF